MQFWLARRSEVPIREQLVTQIILGILSNDLRPGSRLPSTREVARRFRVHANTVSAAYRQLQHDHWVEFRRGSGVYVRQSQPDRDVASHHAVDQRIASLFRLARKKGVPLLDLRERLRRWLEVQPPDHFLLIEPDNELRRILAMEISKVSTLRISTAGLDVCRERDRLVGAIPLALPSKIEAVRHALPAGTDCLQLEIRSANASLAKWLPAQSDLLIGIASSWTGFLKSARTMLISAGFQSETLIFRDARRHGWEKGLPQTVAVVCDSLTATKLPETCRAIPFNLLSESCLAEILAYHHFVTDPLS